MGNKSLNCGLDYVSPSMEVVSIRDEKTDVLTTSSGLNLEEHDPTTEEVVDWGTLF